MKMNNLETIVEMIKDSDAILIGASNGLSISEGYNIFADDDRFKKVFGDFREKYGIRSALQGAMTANNTDNEMWSYIGRMAQNYSTETPLMKELHELVKDKPHFILTSNTDGHFQKAGFKPDKVFELEGNLTEMYCPNLCYGEVIDGEELIDEMLKHEVGTEIPDEYLPKCSHCGSVLKPHLPDGHFFFQDNNYNKRYQNFQEFLEKYHNKKLLILELGIGPYNQMIKAPLMQIAYAEPNANYVTFNKGQIYIAPEIVSKSIGIDGDLSSIIPEMLNLMETENSKSETNQNY